VVGRSIIFERKPAGTVYIQSDLRELFDRLKRQLIIVAVVVSASLMAAMWMSSIFRRILAEPIVRLAETAGIVSRDKIYSVRAPTTGNHDELAILIGTFNEMLAQIQERDTAVQKAHDELERRSRSALRSWRLPTRNWRPSPIPFPTTYAPRCVTSAVFPNCWKKSMEGSWTPLLMAICSASGTEPETWVSWWMTC
jgi:hypothetical protein